MVLGKKVAENALKETCVKKIPKLEIVLVKHRVPSYILVHLTNMQKTVDIFM